MPDPATYRPAPGTIPDSPGVYRFRDPSGRVIYVGKAKSLRSRLNSYFADLSALHPRTRQMVTTAGSVQWTTVTTEVEALQLEYNWIKEFDPRFNVRYRDDKSYPELAVTVGEEYPRLQVMRGPHRKGVRYFGPYAHAWAIRETLDLLLRVFPARTCSAGVFKRSGQIGRPCLLGYIGKCSAPCVGRVSADEHRDIVDAFCDFMAGKAEPLIRRLDKQMQAAAEDLDFERAARLRDDLGAVRRAVEKQAVVFGDGTDADVIGIAADDLLASVQVFHVRGGRVRGQRGWIVDVTADLRGVGTREVSPSVAAASDDDDQDTVESRNRALGALVEDFLLQFYGGRADDDGATAVPREILVPALPAEPGGPDEVPDDRERPPAGPAGGDAALDGDPAGEETLDGTEPTDVTAWLSSLRGGRVRLRVPRRGDKKALADTVTRNAAEALALHRLKRASDLTARSAALSELADTLEMDQAPLRIECIDISHVQGTDVVASLVVFEDGLPKRSDYRRFAIRDRPGDDVASIAEVVRRRFSRGLRLDAADAEAADTAAADAAAAAADSSTGPGPTVTRPPDAPSSPGLDEAPRPPGINPETGRPRRFAYPPQLLVVDGGAPQVNAAAAVLTDLGITDVTVCGLAKRLEEVWVPDHDDPIIFARTSEALYLLQRLRDEAHRFAITYHRAKRSKSMTVSALDQVPGLGEVRRKALVRHFGSVAALRRAEVPDVMAVPGIGRRTAEAVVAALADAGAPRPATGPARPGPTVTSRSEPGAAGEHPDESAGPVDRPPVDRTDPPEIVTVAARMGEDR